MISIIGEFNENRERERKNEQKENGKGEAEQSRISVFFIVAVLLRSASIWV